jgi:hypothetical protein
VRQLVEEPDGDVGRDERNVDDREASGGKTVGERKHEAIFVDPARDMDDFADRPICPRARIVSSGARAQSP